MGLYKLVQFLTDGSTAIHSGSRCRAISIKAWMNQAVNGSIYEDLCQIVTIMEIITP
jgi:hypothetical protein